MFKGKKKSGQVAGALGQSRSTWNPTRHPPPRLPLPLTRGWPRPAAWLRVQPLPILRCTPIHLRAVTNQFGQRLYLLSVTPMPSIWIQHREETTTTMAYGLGTKGTGTPKENVAKVLN